jgi:hypothetical protein
MSWKPTSTIRRPPDGAGQPTWPKDVEALRHDHATCRNSPTGACQSIMRNEAKSPVRMAHARRNRDLDPQVVWRGRDEQHWSGLVVDAPPLQIREKFHPQVLLVDLVHETNARRTSDPGPDAGALRRLQPRPGRAGGGDQFLPPRPELVEHHDPRR